MAEMAKADVEEKGNGLRYREYPNKTFPQGSWTLGQSRKHSGSVDHPFAVLASFPVGNL